VDEERKAILRMNLAVLISAVLTYARSQGGSTTKTKLLKLLYLFDIEAFREKHTTLTGFNWIFHKYGPWASEYDSVLDKLQNSDVITLHTGTKTDLDTIFIDATRPVQLCAAFSCALGETRARRIIEAWADPPTGELLDYVYFHTAPMCEARRGEPLNFNTVLEEEPAPDYKRTKSAVANGERKKRQREFRKSINRLALNWPR
jgi:hypothetical protein